MPAICTSVLHCRALPLSTVIHSYADVSLYATEEGEGDSEGGAMIFDWEGNDNVLLELSDPTEG
jgi:hypothetical protein